jgi:hypothetical protein
MSGEPGPYELVLVGAPTIPEQDEWPADLTSEMAKKPQDLGAPNVAVLQRQRYGIGSWGVPGGAVSENGRLRQGAGRPRTGPTAAAGG